MKVSRIFGISILFATGCVRLSEVEIQNKSSYTVGNLNILVGGNTVSIDKITPGDKATVTFEPKSDSSLKINFNSTQDSKLRSCFLDVYVTNGIRYEFVVVINADGECRLISYDQSYW